MLDTVINDVTGFLVPPRDPVKLADALGEVLHGGPLRRGMGLAGRTRARSRYGWDRIAAEAQSIYERAVVDAGPHLSASSPTRAEAVGA
jgi:glycosyltransferase involved in cell wall biosynthesis